MPYKVETVLRAFESERTVLAFTNAEIFFEGTDIVDDLWSNIGCRYESFCTPEKFKESCLRQFIVTGATMALRKSFLDAIIDQVESPCYIDMWAAWMAPFYGDTVAIPEKLIRYRRHDSNESSTGRKTQKVSHSKYYFKLVSKIFLSPQEKWFEREYLLYSRMSKLIPWLPNTNYEYKNDFLSAVSFYQSICNLAEAPTRWLRLKQLFALSKNNEYSKYSYQRQFAKDAVFILFNRSQRSHGS